MNVHSATENKRLKYNVVQYACHPDENQHVERQIVRVQSTAHAPAHSNPNGSRGRKLREAEELRRTCCQKVTVKSFLFVRTQRAPIPPLESWMICRAQRREVEHTGRAAARADEPRRIWSRC